MALRDPQLCKDFYKATRTYGLLCNPNTQESIYVTIPFEKIKKRTQKQNQTLYQIEFNGLLGLTSTYPHSSDPSWSFAYTAISP